MRRRAMRFHRPLGVFATACELYKNSGDRELAQRHLALSREDNYEADGVEEPFHPRTSWSLSRVSKPAYHIAERCVFQDALPFVECRHLQKDEMK